MPARPRVLHIITRLEPGGSSRNTADSCAAQAADFEVCLLSGPHPGSAALRALLPASVKYVEIPDLQRELSPGRDLRALLALRREIAAFKPDIVHTHTSKAGALGRLAAALYNTPFVRAKIVHTPHGHLLYGYYGFFKTFAFRLAEAALALLTDRLVALTGGEKNESIAAWIGSEKTWTVIHSGVDFKPPSARLSKADLGLPPDCVAAGSIARLEPVKGVEYLLRAAAYLKDSVPALRTVVIGGGSLEPELRELAARLDIKDKVLFAGFRADAAALLPALDIYVQPSLNEAMGRAPLEAQALGIPAVVTDVCGLPETVIPGSTGLVARAGDGEALASAVKVLAVAPELRSRMAAAAKEWALSRDENGLPRFGPESMNLKLKKLYAELLAGRP
jgi:glycosyltransferase involved in cell wall biosynthesis